MSFSGRVDQMVPAYTHPLIYAALAAIWSDYEPGVHSQLADNGAYFGIKYLMLTCVFLILLQFIRQVVYTGGVKLVIVPHGAPIVNTHIPPSAGSIHNVMCIVGS